MTEISQITSSNSETKDDYVLGRDIKSRIRLNQQHFMYSKIFGHILHPTIPRGEGLKIADVATGTGIWLLDLMSEFPSNTSYHGFDVDLSQIPPKEWLPKNVSFSKLDLHEEDLPTELEGAFDIINIRLLLLVVRENDPTSILQKMYRMLKPGGWLQWTEASHLGYLDFVKAQPHLTGESMKAIRLKFASGQDQRFQPTWSLDLGRFFETVGFENVRADRKNCTDFLPWLAFTTDVVTIMYQELVERMPLGFERDETQRIYDLAVQESRAGTAWNGPRVNVIGQKPFSDHDNDHDGHDGHNDSGGGGGVGDGHLVNGV